jgi:hypothetical protein
MMEKCPISCGAHHPNQRPTLENPENPVNPDSKPGYVVKWFLLSI